MKRLITIKHIAMLKTRVLTTVLALCLLAGIFPTTALATNVVASGSCGTNVEWVLDSDGTITISGTGRMDNYDIYTGKPWRNYNYQIKKAIISEGVTSIGRMAFWSTSLEEIILPTTLLYIEEFALSQTNLTEIVLPDSVISIAANSFGGCRELTTVVLGNGLTSLPEALFSQQSTLQTVVFGEDVKIIPERIFFLCSSLESVYIGKNVTTIENDAFWSASLKDVYYSGTEEEWRRISIGSSRNEALRNATIHYNSTWPNDVPIVSSDCSVLFLSDWDAATRTVKFGDTELISPDTYTVANSVDMSGISDLLNKYVLVTMEQGESVLEHTITTIEPVESAIGIVSAMGEHSLTIDGTTYPVREDYVLALYDGDEVLYHTYNGTIMGFDMLEEKSGILEMWDSVTGKATINGQVYPTNYISNIERINELIGIQVHFSVGNASGYTPLIRVSAYAASDTLTISKITPNSGAKYYSQAIDIYFSSAVKLGTGNILIRNLDNAKIIGKFAVQAQEMPISDLTIADLFDGLGPRSTKFYLEFEDGMLLNPHTGKSYGVLSTKELWHMDTVSVQSWSMRNPTGREIADKLYLKVYPIPLAYRIKQFSDGTAGLCFGMAATAGSITKNNPLYSSFTINYIDSLSSVSWEDISSQLSGMTAEEFIGLAHVMKFYPSIAMQKLSHINDLEGLCNAVRSFQDGTGEAVVIDVGGNGQHSILATSIIETSYGYMITAYDSNVPTAYDEIKINLENGKFTEWSISCPLVEWYDITVKKDYSQQIKWATPCSTIYQMATGTDNSDIFSGALDLLKISGFDSFELKNQSGQVVNVANNIIQDALNGFIIPIDVDSDNAIYRNSGPSEDFVCWIENDTPITIQGVDSSISNVILTGSFSSLSVDASANAKVTLSASSWHDGGNITEISSISNDTVSVENHYYDYDKERKEYVFQIEGLVNNMANIIEDTAGTQIKGFSSAAVSIEQNGKQKEARLNNLAEFDSIFVSTEEFENDFTIIVTADTNGDDKPDTILDIEAPSDTTYMVTFDPNGGSFGIINLTTEISGKLSTLPMANRYGYTFNGWFTSASGGEKITIDYVFTSDTTVYAHWTQNSGNSTGDSSPGNSSSGSGSSGGSTSNGGSNYSGSSSHSLTTEEIEHGSVTISPKNPFQGTKVTLTVQPDSGYILNNLAVIDSKGCSVELTKESDTKYTFTMPDSKVTISASFKKAVQQATVEISFIDVSPNAYYYDAVDWAVQQGITKGTTVNTFSPDTPCTRAQVVTFLWRSAGSPMVSRNNPFTDVASGSYYYNAVLWAVEQGITVGTTATTFNPDAVCTRGQAVAFLYRASGSPATTGNHLFEDISANAYYTDAVQWAVNEGVTFGKNPTAFSPNDNCSRAQIVTFLYRNRVN